MRRRLGRLGDERGSALVEFSYLGVLLLVPLVYLVMTVFAVQKAAFAVTTATREAGRAFVKDGATGDARGRAELAATLALADQGLDLAPGQLVIACEADPCLTAGATVHVRLDLAVPLPFVPSLLGNRAASIAVHGRHEEVVDCFAGSGAAALPPPGAPC